MHNVLTLLLALATTFCVGTTSAAAANRSGETPDVLPLDKDGNPIRNVSHRVRSREARQIESILRTNVDENLILYYSKCLEGRPYVAKTLDRDAKHESLVVNIDELDCTTFVETVVALMLTTVQRENDYEAFTRNLRHLRYANGEVAYQKRNHYFSQWIQNNTNIGIVTELTGKANDKRGAYYPFTAKQVLKLNYMSTHIDQYPQLVEQPELVEPIKQSEHEFDNKTVRYIPKRLLGRSKSDLGIENGDILAIVTNKKGLDVSHIGFAFWGDDGKLHLINASSIHKKVVFEQKTLQQYMNEHPSQLGIRVIRVNK